LIHRFNFGPKPGQFAQLLERGFGATQTSVLEHGRVDPGLNSIGTLDLPNLGQIPQGTPAEVTAFWNEVYADRTKTISWWLDCMYASDYPLTERMTWFWHGHWATALDKVVFANPMLKQNSTLRKYSLGNFRDMARAMVVDGAFQFWLDNEENYLSSPNENLARELMELMTLGVNQFTQDDVRAAARALTGYSVNIENGEVGFTPSQHYSKPVTILGTRASLNAETLAELIVSKPKNEKFIADRLWFRFVSATTAPPMSLQESFASRDIHTLVDALVRSSAWTNPANSLVKAPVEWFIGACRALQVRPSSINVGATLAQLSQMGQLPFNPPSVGGWPFGQAWLSVVAFQYRYDLAQTIVLSGDLTPLMVPRSKMVQECADWLGVARWSTRTANDLESATSNPSELAIAALLSPEYVVSA
jgi:uncharacterized protein (DUF1800 family)